MTKGGTRYLSRWFVFSRQETTVGVSDSPGQLYGVSDSDSCEGTNKDVSYLFVDFRRLCSKCVDA
jgi:hypothetical protein